MSGGESDYGSSIDEVVAQGVLQGEVDGGGPENVRTEPQATIDHRSTQNTDYGSDIDPAVAEQKVIVIGDDDDQTDYGSDGELNITEHEVITISDDDSESDYGSDIDPAIAEQLYGIASSKNLRLQLPRDRSELGRTTGQPKCAVLQLPPEIRNLFYEKAFENFIAEWTTGKWYRPPGILFSCKQIFNEAINIFYNTATFRACSYNILERRLLRLRYRHRRFISRLQIDSVLQCPPQDDALLRMLFAGLVAHGAQPKLSHIASAQRAEDDVGKVRTLLSKNRNLQDIKLVTLAASIRDQHGSIIWSEDPTSVLIRFVEEEAKSHEALADT